MLEQGNRGTGEQGSSSGIDDAPEQPQLPLDRPDVDRLIAHLVARVEANIGKPPKTGKRWHDAARLLIDKDLSHESDPVELVIRVIDWATANKFWKSNILSMPALRDDFDRLRIQAREEWQAARAPRGMPSHIEGWQSLKATGTDHVDRPQLRALPGGEPT